MRLFVALELPDEAKDELARVIEALRARRPEAKWVPRDNLHLTLAFLGEVAEEHRGEIETALRSVTGEPGPIRTGLTSLGAFPSARRARVLWAGLDDTSAEIAGLVEAVGRAMEPLGFEPEKRPYAAH